MTFDEFLNGNEQRYENNKQNIMKLQYNPNIDFLYRSSYGEWELNSKLEFMGFFDKQTQRLYGNSYYLEGKYEKEFTNSYYVGSIGTLEKELDERLQLKLDEFIENNKAILKKESKNLFESCVQDEKYKNRVYSDMLGKYVRASENEPTKFKITLEEIIHYNRELNKNSKILEYEQNPDNTLEELFDLYINNEKENHYIYEKDNDSIVNRKNQIGFYLNLNDYRESILNGISNSPPADARKNHNMLKAIKSIEAKDITINLVHKGEEISFKYPKEVLERLYFSTWHIKEVPAREKVEQLYKGEYPRDDDYIKDIKSIEFRKKVIYEDLEFENERKSEIEQKNNEEMEAEL